MKIENINNEAGRLYVQTWLNGLRGLLGWPEEQTLKWAEKWENDLNNPDCLLFHEPPAHYILNLLVPESLKRDCSGPELVMLKQTLLGVIESTDSFCYYQNPKFDWNLARERVKAFLDEVKHQKQTPGHKIEAFLIEYQKRKLVGS